MNHQRFRVLLLALLLATLAACGAPTVTTPTSPPASAVSLAPPSTTVAASPSASAVPTIAASPSVSAAPTIAASPSVSVPTTTAAPAAASPSQAVAPASPSPSGNRVAVPQLAGANTLLAPQSPLPAPDLHFSGERALQHVQAQMQNVPRSTGTPGWQRTGDYIVEQIRAAGWTVEEQRFPYNGISVRNIIAKRGTGPLLILGAHYDTRIYADQDPDPAHHKDPVPGANDGASGVAVLLELAQHINTDQLGREVWLTFFDAEDNGDIAGWDWILGSSYQARNLPRQPEAMVLLDMIGDADQQIYYEQNSNRALREGIWNTAAELGYRQFVPQEKYSMLDDHTPFLQRGIPAVDLIDFDYPPWHTVSDTTDKVSAASLESVGRTLERWLQTRQRAGQ